MGEILKGKKLEQLLRKKVNFAVEKIDEGKKVEYTVNAPEIAWKAAQMIENIGKAVETTVQGAKEKEKKNAA